MMLGRYSLSYRNVGEVPGSSENFLDGVDLEIIPGSLRFKASIYEFATEHK
jgi:hypothetical protein